MEQNNTCSELETLELNIVNPDRLIWISNLDTFNFLLNPLFLFQYSNRWEFIDLHVKFPIFPASVDWLFQILHTPLYWLNFTCFSGYKLQIKLVLRVIQSIDIDINNSEVFFSDLVKFLRHIYIYICIKSYWEEKRFWISNV